MNNNYYQNPMFPQDNNTPTEIYPMPKNENIPPNPGYTPLYGPYNENIFKANKGKLANLYVSFPDSVEWRDKVFRGIVEEAGKDHIVISDPKTGKWTLLVLLYLNYVEFEEPINYPISKKN